MDKAQFLQTFFGDPAYAAQWSLPMLKDFAWGHLSEHSVLILNSKGERVSFPSQGCWILEQGIFNPSIYTYEPKQMWYASYYHDTDHVYPVIAMDEFGKSF